jgi:putative DNA primase/helicase
MVTAVGGALLNQVLTQFAIKIRVFGKLEDVTVPCCMMIFANGNNLLIEGDTTRRSLVGKLDPAVERPELREFDFDPVTLAQEKRAALLVDALTVLRAGIVADDRDGMPPPLGSFERWSRLVRNALIWLGECDPRDVMEDVRGADPLLQALRAMMTAWARVIGVNRWVKAGEVVAQAVEKEKEVTPVDGKEVERDTTRHKNVDLHEAVQGVVKAGEWGKSLGWWLRANKNRVITIEDFGRVRFIQDGRDWKLEIVEPEPAEMVEPAAEGAAADDTNHRGGVPF